MKNNVALIERPAGRTALSRTFTLIELLVTTAQQNCFSKLKNYI